MVLRFSCLLALLTASPAVAACGGAPDVSGESVPPGHVAEVCAEAAPTEARLAFDKGEISAMAVANGAVYVGARSLRVDEEGAIWRVSFDGAPTQQISPRYVGGAVVVSAGTLWHAEPVDAPFGRLVVTDLAGAQRSVVDGPQLVFGEFDIVRDRAFFFGKSGADIALWSYDRDAGVVRVTDDVGGSIFTNGDNLLVVRSDRDGRTFRVVRFDRATGAFEDVGSFPILTRTLAGADRQSLYLHDTATETIRVVDLASGVEKRTIGHAVNGTTASAHLTSDALYVVESGSGRLARIDKTTGEQRVVADLPEGRWLHAFASDACYVYAAVEGARTIARVPRQPR